jgi:hypothetical protein
LPVLSMPRLRGAIAALGCAAVVALASATASAISIGFAADTGASLQRTAQEIALAELSDLGTLSDTDSLGVAYWSLDQPTSILDAGGQAIARIDSWSIALKEDPYIQNNLSVTNTSRYTQVYIVSVAMPIPAFSYDRVINSSLGITATDSDGNGTLLIDVAGSNFYRGMVDNVTKLTLDPANLPITTADCQYPGAGCTATTALGVASLAVPLDIADEIKIMLRFALSPGDAVAITSRFEIASSTSTVPEPDTASLLGFGFALLAFSRRAR